MVTKEELEKSTFVGRHVTVWFMFSCTLVMFILDGIVYKVEAPPGESDWEYGPSVFLMCLGRASDGRWDAMGCVGGEGREDSSVETSAAGGSAKERMDSDRTRGCEDRRDARDWTNDSRGCIHPWARVWARERLTMVMTTRVDRRFRVDGVFHS